MTPPQITNVDARGSTSYNIGRDQNHYHNTYNVGAQIHIAITAGSISDAALQQSIHQTVARASNAVASTAGPLPAPTQSSHQQAMLAADVASSLIISIVRLLVNRTESLDAYRSMKKFLMLLNHAILMTRYALQTFEYTPLGCNLASTIEPTIIGCRDHLQELLDKLRDYREGLSFTSVRDLWSRVLWSGSVVQELSLIQEKLSMNQAAFAEFLAALNSISWTDVGNELCNGVIPLHQFRTFIRHGPLRLQRVFLSQIIVIDHLGRNIPVPTMFCSTWEEFRFIISGYSKGRVGVNFIESGDFRLLRSDNNQTVRPSQLISAAQHGTVLEMGIVLWKAKDFETTRGVCPRQGCHHLNTAMSLNGWIECAKCSGKFRVDLLQIPSPSVRLENQKASPGEPFPWSSRGEGDLPLSEEETCFFRLIHVLCIDVPSVDTPSVAPPTTGPAPESSPINSSQWRMALNNFLQGCYGHARHLTCEAALMGPPHQGCWIAILYFKGVEYGRGMDTSKTAALEIAAYNTLGALHGQ